MPQHDNRNRMDDRLQQRLVPAVSGGAVAETVVASPRPQSIRPAEAAGAGRLRGRELRLNVEVALYAVIAVLAALTRLWDLSSRALHHDESLHAYFSWLYATGSGYVHDPLMHGPSLFHGEALAFLLFGDNDYVSRLWPALLGIVLVLMPALLRGPRLLGRWGALAFSTLLLVSPAFLYQSTYLRHDPWVLVCTLGIVASGFRYLERPERRWIVLAGVLTGLMFATMEVAFIIAFVLATFILGVVTWQVARRTFAVYVGTVAGLAIVWKALPALGAGPLPTIPWEDPSSANVRTFALDLIVHPVVLAALGVLLLGVIAGLAVLERARDPEADGWVAGLFGRAPAHSTTWALGHVLEDRRSLWIAVAGGLAVFVVLYTSLFTNMFGLASGTVGALGYWLGQQNVQRADEPWFYYLLLLPQYEFVATLLFPVGIAVTAWQLLPRLRRGEPVGRRNYLRAFAIYWALVNLAVFSWAGEKMPWLTVHMSLPLTLLAASMIGAGIEQIEARARSGRLPRAAALALGLGVPLIAGAWFLLWGWASAGPWVQTNTDLVRQLRPAVAERPWLLYLPLLALLALLAWGVARLGLRMAATLAGVSMVAVILFAQAHTAFHVTYQSGDTPTDMLIYVQTAPDVPRVVSEIGTLSRELTGGKDLEVWYDSGASWPFQWYLRDYPNRRYFGNTLNEPPNAPIVLISTEELAANPQNADMLSGYTYQEYAMRWWFPEDETYRRFAYAPDLNKKDRQNYQDDRPGPYSLLDTLGSVWRSLWSLREPQQQAKMFRLMSYRELWAPLGSYNFRVYVRNDLLPTYNDIRY